MRARARGCARSRRGRPSSRCARSRSARSRRSPSGTTRPRTGTRSSTSPRRSGCSAGRRGARTRRRCAGPTTGTSPTARRYGGGRHPPRAVEPAGARACSRSSSGRLLEHHAAVCLRRSNPDRLVDPSAWSGVGHDHDPLGPEGGGREPGRLDLTSRDAATAAAPVGSGGVDHLIAAQDLSVTTIPRLGGHPPAGRSSATMTCRAPPGRARATPPADHG